VIPALSLCRLKQWFVDVDKKLEKLGGKSLKEISLQAATSGE